MTRARDFANVISGQFDLPAGSLDNSEVVDDASPQLGGNLDLNSNNITGTGNINTTGTATFSGDLTVDTNTLHVDSTNNNVGIGTTSIEDFGGGHVTLEVAGSTTSQGGIFKSATSDSAGTGTSGTEMLLFTDSTNGGSINVVSSDALRLMTANTARMTINSSGASKHTRRPLIWRCDNKTAAQQFSDDT